jgi:hypothetical protein
MIRYALACEHGHQFESWFANSSAYENQAKKRLIACPVCNSAKVEKAIMAPNLSATKKKEKKEKAAARPASKEPASKEPVETGKPEAPSQQQQPAPVAMMSPQEREFRSKLKELRDHLVRNADYVGQKFPEEARKMHYGEIEHRSIYGEASRDQAKELHEEGIEFHPLPVLPDEWN